MRNEVGRNERDREKERERERIYGRRQSQTVIERMENDGGNELGCVWQCMVE